MSAASRLARATLIGSLAWWASAAAGADDAAARFDQGVAAYRDGRLDAALENFLAARAGGIDTPQLQYDLALTWYRLGEDESARQGFERLRSFAGFADIADFHLALLAARAGRRDEADQTWRRLEQDAAEPGVRERSRVARARLSGTGATAAAGYVLAAAGHDSNPGLLDESLQPSGAGSAFLDLFGSFDAPLAEHDGATAHLRGGAYLHDYSQDNGLDQRGLFGGFESEHRHGGRRASWSLDAGTSQLDGAHFTDIFAAGVAGEPRAGGSGLALRGQVSRINAAPAYAYLEGWRARAELEHIAHRGHARLRTGYQFEYNDRADLEIGAEFFSHSPMRHRLALTLDHPAGEDWTLQWSARYRYSAYRDPNVFLDGGVLREQRRVENLLQTGLQLRRRLGQTIGGLIEYQYSHNAASIAAFGYTRQVLSIGVEWMPRG